MKVEKLGTNYIEFKHNLILQIMVSYKPKIGFVVDFCFSST